MAVRTLREQVLAGALATLIIFYLVLLTVIQPLLTVRADAQAQIRTAALLEARLRAGSRGLVPAGKLRRGAPPAILTESAAAAGISLQQIGPATIGTRAILGDVPFDRLISWISDVEQTSRLRVVQARIERAEAPGHVHAQVVFAA
ncbi:MAG: type II secretion system protein M [Novosphingobium sp.]|nr:type II secretion system protein M [Novosphingobium sp.]